MSANKHTPERLLIYTHYNPVNSLSGYVLHTLKEMKPFVKKLYVVSNSVIENKDKEFLCKYADVFIQRENRGFDFGAWRDVIHQIGWADIESYDHLILMNDTCFGPIFDMGPVFNKMEAKNLDFWGITEYKNVIDKYRFFGKKVPTHLQSYFLSFPKKTLKKEVFQTFFNNITDEDDVQAVIDQYEIGLSVQLKKSGLIYGSYLESDDKVYNDTENPIFIAPDQLVKSGAPFLKVKSFFLFPHPLHLKKLIKLRTTYDTEFIDDHIYRTYGPEKAVYTGEKSLFLTSENSGKENSIPKETKVAIHIHVYFLDVFKRYKPLLSEMQKRVDFYFTTDTVNKSNQIQKIFETAGHPFEIIITENRGRDVLPWLTISKKLENYDVVAHTHTKKSSFAPEWVGESWMEETLEVLLKNSGTIIHEFSKNRNLGIVIPDVPYFFKVNERILYPDEEMMSVEPFLERLGLDKKLPEDSFWVPVMPYGNMFWYRPDALKPITNGRVDESWFTPEPIPVKNTTAHIIERLPVYVSWNRGYDFLIIQDERHMMTGFSFQQRTHIPRIVDQFYETWQWKIGRIFTSIPGIIKRFIRNRNQHLR